MGLLTGSVSYLRFLAQGDLPAALEDAYAAALADHGFRDIDPDGEEERNAGWVRLDDPFTATWQPHEITSNNGLLVWRLRIDTLKIPAVMLKHWVDAAEREFLARQGRDKLTRPEREALKHKVRKDMRRRSLAKMALVDIAWNLTTGEVRLFATSRAVATLFVEVFEKTFALTLRPVTPMSVLWLRGLDDAALEALAATEPERFHLDAGRRPQEAR